MSFKISRATPGDIPGMVDVRYAAFDSELSRKVFPDTPAGRAWWAQTFERAILDEGLNIVHMIMTEDLDDPEGKRKVVSLSKWHIFPAGGSVARWEDRWVTPLAEGMPEELFIDGVMKPMAQQHVFVTGERPHYFLELLATDPEFEKRGLGSNLVRWGCEAADQAGLECYVDAGVKAKSLYEKHGFVEQAIDGPRAKSAAMLRAAKKE